MLNDAAAYDSFCDAIHTDRAEEPTGPATSFIGDDIFAAVRASSLSQLTPALGRDADVDTVVATPCTAEHHAHLVANEWHRLIPIGQSLGLEYANCPDCPAGERATFSRPLPIERFWTNHRHDVLRVERADGHQEVIDGDDEEVVGLLASVRAGDADERWQGEDATRDDAFAAADASHDALHGEAA